MTFIAAASRFVERTPLPDMVTKLGISHLVSKTGRQLAAAGKTAEALFAAEMNQHPIAENTDAANTQHYELPPAFFSYVLGPRRKYSCCLYDAAMSGTLAEAEERALAETVSHADLADGQTILELGCGWGSLTLWMAEKFSAARITAVSNSGPQREYIEQTAARRGFKNVRVITADMNDFAPEAGFDRVVSVEMFEHIANWQALLGRIKTWLNPEGRVFLHVFSHRSTPYRFDHHDEADWIAQHFFTGGLMPSHGLIRHFDNLFTVEAEWQWNGGHYERTALDWLANFDRHDAEITALMQQIYGTDATLWKTRWRLFFLATAGLFGHAGGKEWGVSHYRLRAVTG